MCRHHRSPRCGAPRRNSSRVLLCTGVCYCQRYVDADPDGDRSSQSDKVVQLFDDIVALSRKYELLHAWTCDGGGECVSTLYEWEVVALCFFYCSGISGVGFVHLSFVYPESFVAHFNSYLAYFQQKRAMTAWLGVSASSLANAKHQVGIFADWSWLSAQGAHWQHVKVAPFIRVKTSVSCGMSDGRLDPFRDENLGKSGGDMCLCLGFWGTGRSDCWRWCAWTESCLGSSVI